jgi:catechol 2,3-dioxygenase-like lactoylglutathione lyase family enzyme
MRLALCCALLLPVALAAEWKVDHCTIAGPSLKHLREILDLAGLRTEYGGEHSSGLTEMALASFPDGSYLELIAWTNAAAPHPGQSWAKFLDQQGGPCAWAIHVEDIGREAGRLKAAGVKVGEPVRSGRVRVDGVRLEWEMEGAGPGDRGSLLPFLIHDLTPRDHRVYPSGKPTTGEYAGISRVVIAVKDLRGAIALYRRAFALAEPKEQKDARLGAALAWFAGTPVILAAPVSAHTWLAERIARFGEAPCAFLLRDTGHPRSGDTIWFDSMVTWLDPDKLEGLQLGIE